LSADDTIHNAKSSQGGEVQQDQNGHKVLSKRETGLNELTHARFWTPCAQVSDRECRDEREEENHERCISETEAEALRSYDAEGDTEELVGFSMVSAGYDLR
jgi:hypothetical protein